MKEPWTEPQQPQGCEDSVKPSNAAIANPSKKFRDIEAEEGGEGKAHGKDRTAATSRL